MFCSVTYIRNSQQHALGRLHAPTAPGILSSPALLTAVVDAFFISLFLSDTVQPWKSIRRFDGGMTDDDPKIYMDAG